MVIPRSAATRDLPYPRAIIGVREHPFLRFASGQALRSG
jgi:hypothetical protein